MPQPHILIPPTGASQADEWVKLGIEAQVAGKFADADRHYRHALRIQPRHPIATQNFAVLYAQQGQHAEAMLTIERASLMDGTAGLIYYNWALMALEAEQLDTALKAARKGVEVEPSVNTRLALAMVCTGAGRPDEAIPQYQAILKEQPEHPVAGPNSCFVQTLTDATPEQLKAQRAHWYAKHGYKGEKKPHTNDKTIDRPLRVGYLSGDFKRHSAGFIFGSVLFHHDTSQFHPYLYSTLPVSATDDPVTKRFQEAGQWRDVQSMNDEQLEAKIREDNIDILVDLSGHTNGGRLALFTRKPAPIQVTAWGFAHGTGCPEIDYFLADPIAVPDAERQWYTEKVLDLPCIVGYAPPEDYKLEGTSPLPAFQNDFITFGCYGRYEKLSDEFIKVCGEILKRIPTAKMTFKDHAFRRPYSIRRVQQAMPHVAEDRLLFGIGTTHPEHLHAYQQCDLILDPFPHTGGVVCLEQLYMGVPMVTRYGTQAAGRTASSVLTAMGHADWMAKSSDEYIEKAVTMAQDWFMLNRYRKTLRTELLESPVVQGYRQSVETLYREMWRSWCS